MKIEIDLAKQELTVREGTRVLKKYSVSTAKKGAIASVCHSSIRSRYNRSELGGDARHGKCANDWDRFRHDQ
jgi:hypothetical protein